MRLQPFYPPIFSNVGSRYTDDSGSDGDSETEESGVEDLNPPQQAAAAAAPTSTTRAAAAAAAAAPVVPPASAPSSGPARTVNRAAATAGGGGGGGAAAPLSPAATPAVLVASSSLDQTSSNPPQNTAPPPSDISVDMPSPLPGNPYLHVVTDVLMALKAAVTQHHFSMVIVATGLVFIIAGGSVRTPPLFISVGDW